MVCLACHECAHLFVLAGFDVPVEAWELHPFGAVIHYRTPPEGLGSTDALVAAAGPLQSFLLAAAGLYLEPLRWIEPSRLEFFVQLNLALACFNLLPVWPLDGGRVLRAWLAPRMGDAAAVVALARAGRWVALTVLALSALASVAFGRPVWVPGLLGLFLFKASSRPTGAGRETLVRTMTKGRRRLRDGTDTGALLVVADSARLGAVLRRLRPDRYHLLVAVDEHGRKMGELTEDEFAAAVIELGLQATIGMALGGGPRRT